MVRKTVVVGLATMLVYGVVAVSQAFPLGLLPTSDEPVDASVWTMESTFEISDPLVIHLRVRRPVFVYLFDLQPDGIVRLLFPNAFSSNDYVLGSHQLPDAEYRLTTNPPAGIDELLVFATTAPLPLAATASTNPFPSSRTTRRRRSTRWLRCPRRWMRPRSWGVGWTAIQIVGEASESTPPVETVTVPSPPPPPPFSVTPGGVWHENGGGWSYGIPAKGWYWFYDRDAFWHLCWVYGG